MRSPRRSLARRSSTSPLRPVVKQRPDRYICGRCTPSLGKDRLLPSSLPDAVVNAKPANAELLTVTLDKSSSGFSPTTRYRDYAISRTLIHWESQSITRADSATGLRYRHHERDGRSIFLFTRMKADDRAFWFLGPARYVSHVGERPMAITWELEHTLSGDLYQSFAAAVA